MISIRNQLSATNRYNPYVFFLALALGFQVDWMVRHRSLDDFILRGVGATVIGLGLGLVTVIILIRLCERRSPCIERGLDFFAHGWILVPAALIDPFYPLIGLVIFTLIKLYQRDHVTGVITRRWVDGMCQDQTREAESSLPWIRVAILLAALSIIVMRAPELFLYPRFWAEDGSHVFAYAFTHDWFSTLLRREEYYLLISNVACLFATRLVSLETSPLVITVIALLVKLTAISIVVWGQSPLWRTPLRKLIVVLIIIFAPSTEEIWLNVNGSQYYLSLITALVLCEAGSNTSDWQRYTHRGLILLAGLTGVLSSLLAPIYWMKWWRTRHRDVLVLAVILTVTMTIQYINILISPVSPGRTSLPTTPMVALILAIKTFLLPLDVDTASLFSDLVKQARVHLDPIHFRLFGYSYLLIETFIVGWLAYRLRHSDGLYVLACAVTLALFCAVFGIAGIENSAFFIVFDGNRYFAVPNMLILIAALAAICPQMSPTSRPVRSALAIVFSALVVVNGAQRFYDARVSDPTWPEWRQEVAKWRQDPSYKLRIWPPDVWMDLDKPR